ncbi:asparagine synthase (glutamine-hydrolyzing) [Sulfurisoma sediminicola]|uniref:asparagine synthase (glutamine-hydrolyzing) n=1 Tax=Sulfurisoma sediminicola TaxID=1381557 RepID=A0A497XKS4_9PROT|nr:asparagine synthase (glutamine-hydrolyzing) [Sulfurisoma sediminicola]RLJ67990.1 asparagine synthase (glutamine-hydrolysing) [Sulfurisoma sediminicola]
MCGIAGYFQLSNAAAADASAARAMADRIVTRGPDDAGSWAEGPVALAHRRLSILDLSPAGHQPMHSACGRYVIVFNGEIYNWRDMRAAVEGEPYFAECVRAWRGHSDTEVILAAVACWGFEAALQRMVGMFAIALWDRRERALFLARDRLGEKPLYYGRFGRTLLFGSELKALRAHRDFRADIDRDALALLMRHNYIPAPYSIYRGVRKLPPASYLRVGADGAETLRSYWSAQEIAARGQAERFEGDDAAAIDELERVLSRSIREQMVADVPLGAFLSGGIDSSTVVALMQAQSVQPVRTFSIGFHEEGYNEAQHAREVARHLGTEHTELYVTPQQAQAVIPRLPDLYDEPFADSSQIPTFLVAELARRHVTVSLSGDGGDELFAGYNRYFFAGELWRGIARVPRPLRALSARSIHAFSPRTLDALARWTRPLLPRRLRHANAGDKLHKLADILGHNGLATIYRDLVSHWKEPAELVLGATEPPTALTDPARRIVLPDIVSTMMCLDTVSYLPDDILVKVDRAAMGVSLETRVPLLDHRVVEFAWRLPMSLKVRGGDGKWILRQLLYRHVPRTLVERPKMGFGVPIDAWLRGPLRDWAESLLAEDRLRREGYFDPQQVREKWREHLSGGRNWQYLLWDVLMFQAWLERHHG